VFSFQGYLNGNLDQRRWDPRHKGYREDRIAIQQHANPELIFFPYGNVGDRLWVKEKHFLFGQWCRNGFTKLGSEKWQFSCEAEKGVLFPDNPPETIARAKHQRGWFERTPLFMPKWVARNWLEVTGVRAEMVQEISAFDCLAEGIEGTRKALSSIPAVSIPASKRTLDCFGKLWDSINAKRGYPWSNEDLPDNLKTGKGRVMCCNPWVWVVSFKRIKP